MPGQAFKAFLRKPLPVYAVCINDPDDFPTVQAVEARGAEWAVKTAHGWVGAEWGDYLLTDGKGDFWPVRATIFLERYVPAQEPQGNP